METESESRIVDLDGLEIEHNLVIDALKAVAREHGELREVLNGGRLNVPPTSNILGLVIDGLRRLGAERPDALDALAAFEEEKSCLFYVTVL